MNNELFAELLRRGEGIDVDYKSKQYRFIGEKGPDAEKVKSKLLKDVLAFANAERTRNAFILVGVKDEDGECEVVGINPSDAIDDAKIQEFVESKANKPVPLRCYSHEHEGKHVWVIEVIGGDPPYFVPKDDYGEVRNRIAYTRRGSKNVPLSPDDLIAIGRRQVRTEVEVVSLSLRLEKPGTETPEELVEIKSRWVEYPTRIPDYTTDIWTDDGSPLGNIRYMPAIGKSRSFLRDVAEFIQVQQFFTASRLCVRNTGMAGAIGVVVTLTYDKNLWVMPEKEYPNEPSDSVVGNITPIADQLRASNVTGDPDRREIVVTIGDVNPGLSIYSDLIYIGSQIDGEAKITFTATAANLPNPIVSEAVVKVIAEEVEFDLDDVKANARRFTA